MSASSLEYAPGAPLVRRRRVRRAVLVVLVLGVTLAGWRYGPRTWRRSVLLYHQDRCLRYVAAADIVVYESEQRAAGELLKRQGYAPMQPMNGGGTGPVAVHVPAALRNLDQVIAPGGTGMRAAVLFLGELRAKDGARRLVIVQRAPTDFVPMLEVFDLLVTVFEPATLRRDLRLVPASDAKMVVWNGPVSVAPTKDLRFYAGRRVAGESDRFTIRYWLDGGEGMIAGRLNDEGTDVELEIKSGPAAGSVWAHPIARDSR